MKYILYIIRLLPPEFSHSCFIFAAKNFPSLMPKLKIPQIKTDFFGKSVKNYYGMAAGLDKNADCIPALFKMGFGIVEIGTVTPKPQKGNAKPRIWRFVKEKSLLNAMGFPNKGMDFVLQNVQNYKRKNGEILGVNIGRNKDGSNEDYLVLISKFHTHCDYIAINISSPNTPNLRDTLNNNELLDDFLSQINFHKVKTGVKIPFLLKISPDVQNLADIYQIACKNGIDGFILTNTTVDKSTLPEPFKSSQIGGVSGELLCEKSSNILKEFTKINSENKFVISVGGISTNEQVAKRISNGAHAVQVYTSLIFGGFM